MDMVIRLRATVPARLDVLIVSSILAVQLGRVGTIGVVGLTLLGGAATVAAWRADRAARAHAGDLRRGASTYPARQSHTLNRHAGFWHSGMAPTTPAAVRRSFTIPGAGASATLSTSRAPE